MPQIYVLSGPDIGRSFGVAHGDTLGRATDCVITLKHASLSRKHAHIECVDERWYVVDDGSRNGVFVDKQRTERAELLDMSEFQLGELHLRFRISAPVESAPAPRPAPPVAEPARDPATSATQAAAKRIEEPEELSLDGDGDSAGDAGGDDGPVFTSGGGAGGVVIRPSGPSPYQAAGPFAMPKDPAAQARRPGPPAPAPRRLEDAPSAPDVVERRSSAPPPPPPPPTLQHSMLDTGFGRGAAPAAGATISRAARKPGERILQYNKVESGGVELAQLSAPVRWSLYAVGVALMAALAWFAFRGTSALKSRALEGAGDNFAEDELEPAGDSSISGDSQR